MNKSTRYSPEVRERAVRLVFEHQGMRGGMTSSDREQLKGLQRENRELKRANEILRTASAFLHRRSSTAD
ncbi:MAG: hypothetical protein IID57_02170 [Proteobacteria bacterium]|nr:hypothetical protein [Pseudomonadota bacterium]